MNKKTSRNRFTKFSLLNFLIFFVFNALILVGCTFIMSFAYKKFGENYLVLGLFVFLVILISTAICTAIDMIRRYKLEEDVIKQILDATQKIANGDFDIKLQPKHTYDKYDQYDKIKVNLNLMAEELKKNEVLKSDFISNVSHEIKTPLAVIQNYAKALQNKSLDDATKEKYSNILISTSKKLNSLVTNILKLNKLENQQIVDFSEGNVGELLRTCVLAHEDLLEKKKLKYVCDIDDTTLTTSLSSLEIVFNNLLSNAIKFTDEGGNIDISLHVENEYVIIKVADTGCGIDEETGKHIFDKFYQGDTSHSSEGNGLGLALVKKAIDNIGGEISVESEVGVGSAFTIKLKNKTDI